MSDTIIKSRVLLNDALASLAKSIEAEFKEDISNIRDESMVFESGEIKVIDHLTNIAYSNKAVWSGGYTPVNIEEDLRRSISVKMLVEITRNLNAKMRSQVDANSNRPKVN